MKWINIIGLSLQFLSFWLVAPELLGETTLKRLKKGLVQFVSLFPIYFFSVLGLFTGLGFGIYGIMAGLNASKGGGVDLKIHYTIIASSMFFYFILLGFRKKIEKWMFNKIGTPLVDSIINDDVFRKKILLLGALFFTLGFLFQLIVLVLS